MFFWTRSLILCLGLEVDNQFQNLAVFYGEEPKEAKMIVSVLFKKTNKQKNNHFILLYIILV